MEQVGDRPDAVCDLAGVEAGHLEWESDVLGDRHLWVQRMGLERHRDVALAGAEFVDAFAVEADLTVGRILQARDHPQDGALAAAGRAEQDAELAVVDVEVDVAHRNVTVVEDLAHIVELNARHRDPSEGSSLAHPPARGHGSDVRRRRWAR